MMWCYLSFRLFVLSLSLNIIVIKYMKKKNVFKWWGVVLILSMCSVHAEAQDLKSVLTGVAKAVIGKGYYGSFHCGDLDLSGS